MASGLAPFWWTLWLGGDGPALFKLDRALVAQRRVPPLPIVPHLEIAEDRLAGLLARAPVGPRDQLGLQGGEEALHHRVVPAIAHPAHARAQAPTGERGAVDGARILAPAVGGMHQARPGLALPHGHRQRV